MSERITFSADTNLPKLLTTNLEMKDRIEREAGLVFSRLRMEVSGDAKRMFEHDPREAYRAVLNSVYVRVVGGNVNINQRRTAGRRGSVPPPSNRYGNITGPVRGRLRRTVDLMSYYGPDRGFILRFENAGTKARATKNMDGSPFNKAERVAIRAARDNWHNKKRGIKYKNSTIGNRGVRTGHRGWFDRSSRNHAEKAMNELIEVINRITNEMSVK